MLLSPVPHAGGLLDAAYFSPEAGPEVTDAVSESAKASFLPSTASPHKSAAPAEERLQAIDIVDAVYLSEPDAESAEDMGELAPFERMSDLAVSPQSSVVSDEDADDITESSGIMKSPLTPTQPASPAVVGTADMAALDAETSSDAFGSPMQEIPGSNARLAAFSGTVYSASPVDCGHDSFSGSATEEDAAVLPGGESHMVCDDTAGLSDRWQMEDTAGLSNRRQMEDTAGLSDRWQMEETAAVVNNTRLADVPARVLSQVHASQPARVSSQVHASPSYDPRCKAQGSAPHVTAMLLESVT